MTPEIFADWAQKTPKIRQNIIRMITQAGSGHPGGSLSMVELLMTLFAPNGIMQLNEDLTSNNRDRFVLSKGHGVPALYAVLGHLHIGGVDENRAIETLRQLGSEYQGHPDRVRLPIMEASTGSLGQGASIAQGIALGYKMENNPHRVYSILGDGEMQEGQIWEVALSAAHKKLNNLTLILDYNKAQIDGYTKDVLGLDPLKEKWEAFGWHVHEIDGHKYEEIYHALKDTHSEKPSMIIANTIKGRGVSFMEGLVGWHGKAPSAEECEKACQELETKTEIGL